MAARVNGARITKRHMRDAVVDEEAVRALAVIAEALAVIADDDDDGPSTRP